MVTKMENIIYTAYDTNEKCAICASADYDKFANRCFEYLYNWYAENKSPWKYVLENYHMTTEELRAVVTDDIYHPFWEKYGIEIKEYPLIDERA